MVRKTVFWIHLIVGVAAGLVVAMMSLTGALLTYERQILAWSDRDQLAIPNAVGERQPLADLVAAAAAQRSVPAPTAPSKAARGCGRSLRPSKAGIVGSTSATRIAPRRAQ